MSWADLGAVDPSRSQPRVPLLRALFGWLWSMLSVALAVGVAIQLVHGVSADNPERLLAGLVLISLLDASGQPLLRRLASYGSAGLAILLGVGFQVILLGITVVAMQGLRAVRVGDLALALLIATALLIGLRWLLGISDTSYALGHAMGKVRPLGLGHRRPAQPRERRRGLLVAQLDGVSPGVLHQAMDAGLIPNLARWLYAGAVTMRPWWACVPSTTPASMAGFLHRDQDEIPAFRYWDRDLQRIIVTNRPVDAELVEARFRPGRGILRDGGVAISTMFTGEASSSLLVMSRAAGTRGLGPGGDFIPFFSSLSLLPTALLLSVGEVTKELYQARRQQVRRVRPRVNRLGWFVLLRGVTNVLLRRLNLTLVARQMGQGAPVIFVDLVDYDEIAHHAGPVRPESLRALEGLDGVLGQLHHVAGLVDTRYDLVVVSDHGQSLGATFEQVNGHPLGEVVARLMGEGMADLLHSQAGEDWGPVNTLVTSLLGGFAPDDRRVLGPDRPAKQPAAQDIPEVVVIGSGNLGLINFPQAGQRLTLEDIERAWPAVLPGLLLADGIGVLLALAGDGDPVVLHRDGTRNLTTGEVSGVDPLARFPARAAPDLLRLARLEHCADLVVVSDVTPDGQVHAFENLVGSHGGLGGQQNDGLLIHPAHWNIAEDLLETVDGQRMLVGSWAVGEQLARWRPWT